MLINKDVGPLLVKKVQSNMVLSWYIDSRDVCFIREHVMEKAPPYIYITNKITS